MTDAETIFRYRRKVKTVDELCEVLGPRPRRQKVIMCHGVFDIVHPGHVRHLGLTFADLCDALFKLSGALQCASSPWAGRVRAERNPIQRVARAEAPGPGEVR